MKREVVVCIEYTVEDSPALFKVAVQSGSSSRPHGGLKRGIAQARQIRKMMRIAPGLGMTTNQQR